MIPDTWSALWTAIAPAAANHLWQSTLFAAAAAVLTLALRKNPARVRYRLWLIASLKFLIPFSLLIGLSSHLIKPHVAVTVQSDVYSAVEELSLPFSQTAAPAVRPLPKLTTKPADRLPSWPEVVMVVWLCGFVATLGLWCWRWCSVASCLRRAVPMAQGRELVALRQLERTRASHQPLAVFLSSESGEPGVFGIFRPVLLWPAGISKHLQATHVEAILAHELAHVRRHDNLTAAMHMLVEAIFWFHPGVWWLGAQMAEERERACDEEVLQLGKSAQVYAESILKTCEFCVASPLACVSGVTGADLKKRILRIMTEADRAVRKLDYARKLLLCAAALVGVASPIVFGLVHISRVSAQATSDNTKSAQGLAGTWQGTLHAGGRDLRTVFKISKAEDGAYKAVFYSIDQGPDGFPVTRITMDGGAVKMTLTAIDGSYAGKLSPDGNTIAGIWTQGPNPLPLDLARATPDAEWIIPPPEKKMDANASPGFEVATIKPSAPNQPGKGFGYRGGHFSTRNTNLNDLIGFAYGLHLKQIVDAPAWFGTDLYDIEGKPDVEGRPNQKQTQAMVQKLLADRFQLKFHHDKRELSVYVISVAGGSPKITRTASAPDDPSAFFFRGLGDLTVRNQSMTYFATWMQTVLDKPVVDQTELPGKYDFQLKWTPDDSQFGGFRGTGATVPPPTDDPKAPPNLYTAMQEQLGLKMGPAKIPDDVIVIDHVEKPSEN